MYSLKLFSIVAILAAAFADDATWQTTSVAKVTTLVGVYATNKNEAYGAVLDNSLGAGLIHTADYGATSDFIGPAGAMNMDVAFTSNGEVGCVVGVGGIFVGSATGNYTKVPNLHTVTQNVESIFPAGLGVTGQFSLGRASANGVAVSLDSGNNWNLYDIGLGDGYSARYSSFPSQTTWYVSSGMWPSAKLSATKDGKQITKNFLVDEKNFPQFVAKKSLRSSEGGYYGGISKTTDAGKTWTQVYDANGVFYFNEISCFNELSCIAVGENDSGYIVGTQDGGATWKSLLVADGISLMAVKMLSETEAWASGGAENAKRQLVGYYYHTVDGGATWNLVTSGGYSMDLSFSGGVGYSASITSNYATIAVYK